MSTPANDPWELPTQPHATVTEGTTAGGAACAGAARASGPAAADCSACGVAGCSASSTSARQPLTGWRFGLVCGGAFGLPLGLAAAAAALLRSDPQQQLSAGFSGLLLGMTLAAIAARLLRRESEVD
jgi:hypothetical protein